VDLDADEEDAEYRFTPHNDDDRDDDGARMMHGQRRNVFSKIPRVGRSHWSTYETERPSSL